MPTSVITASTNFDWIDQVIHLIEITAWPATVLLMIWLARNEIRLLLPLVQRVRYKDVEIEFTERLAQVTEDVDQSPLPKSSQIEDADTLYSLIEISPPSAVIEAWKRLEQAASKKVKQLGPKDETYRDPLRRPLDYLDFKGALVPSAASAARDLRSLQNVAAHAGVDDISREDAIQYIAVAYRIQAQIEAISELPAVKLTALTSLIIQLNQLIDSKKYDDITIDDVYRWIDEESILTSLQKRTSKDSDLSIYGESGPYSNFAAFYHQQMKNLAGGYAGDHGRKWGVENLGLCLLLAWTNELIQQGTGWYPREM